MLPRRLRLSRAAISNPKKGVRLVSPHFSITAQPGQIGCAVVVSKKTEKTSVGRSRLKRRVLEIIGPRCKDGYSVIVYARSGSNTLSFGSIKTEITELLQQLPPHSRLG